MLIDDTFLLSFGYATFLDLPAVLDGLESGAHASVFSEEFIGWFYRLGWFKALFFTLLRDLFRRDLKRSGYHLLVANSQKEIAAFALLRTRSANENIPMLVEIKYFAVVASLRNRGIGRAFLEHIIQIAPRPCTLRCECTPHAVTMRSLLSRLGFKVTRTAKAIAGKKMLPFRLEKKLANAVP
jgi:ribosomal protein S18 acetylase RimI-like enzyme